MSENSEDTLPGLPQDEPNAETEDTILHTPPDEPETPPARPRMGRPFDYWLLWLVALASVALNVWLIGTLLAIQRQLDDARMQAAQGLIEAANDVSQFELGTVDYTIVVDEVIPIDITVPVSETFMVPISHTIEVNSAALVQVPILGPQSIPFSVKVPIDFEVSIPISSSFAVTDTVPVQFDVPISISLDDTPLGSLKGDIQSYLLQIAEELRQQPAAGAAP